MVHKKELLTIGELAKEMNVTVRTLQYYDQENLLKPSARSEGGRRLYSSNDIVTLHQILSMKFLGFSLEKIRDNLFNLDSPAEVAQMLSLQRDSIVEQIAALQEALDTIDALNDEIKQMDTVDFEKYADIIAMLRHGVKDYWMMKLFDDKLTTHLKTKYWKRDTEAAAMYEEYKAVLDETFLLKEQGIKPDDDSAIAVAEKWWAFIMDFTDGDPALLPSLMQFNETKDGWDEALMQKQASVDEYLGQSLMAYFEKTGIELPQTES